MVGCTCAWSVSMSGTLSRLSTSMLSTAGFRESSRMRWWALPSIRSSDARPHDGGTRAEAKAGISISDGATAEEESQN